ncbi:tyrosine-type recombinase/integrase [Ostreibacterium oceani]|uniref:Tyrosine-type recombinase/integrase n=1 Tax=Ostreibacterium oceani TaxID=2654998 RepID=A0A6N7EZ98_9GAMM|nr:tyrosine-type recombinase/integrase [Ostreibacterium oceani]MPV86880.1 tyrosine-type recombinase/integrase [Ostreibacterium oceani]
MPLSDLQIKKAKPAEKKYKLNDGHGLFLLVKPNGSKFFYFRFSQHRKQREKYLGEYPAVTLAAARIAVALARENIDRGLSPFPDKKAKTKITFSDVTAQFLKQKAKHVTPKTLDTARSRFENHVFPFIGNRAITEISTAEVKAILVRLDDDGKSSLAIRTRSLISAVFRYGILDGVCDYDVAAPLTGFIKRKKVKHMPALTTPREVSALLGAIWGYHGAFRTRVALKLMAYCFVRTQEMRFAEWSEFDFDRGLWVIPAEKMKMARPHIVPLAHQSIELLKSINEYTGDRKYVFSNPRRDKDVTMSENTINNALKILGFEGVMVGHGFRAMASTMLHEQGYSPLHIEMQLAHAEKNSVKAAYNHAEYLAPRATMMQNWADYLDDLRLNPPR